MLSIFPGPKMSLRDRLSRADLPLRKRLEVQSSNIRTTESSLEPKGKYLSFHMKQAAGTVRQLGPPAGRFGSACVQHQLSGPGALHVSPIFSSSEVSDKDNDGAGGSGVCDAILVSSAMVPVSARVVVRAGSRSSEEAVVVGPGGQTTSTSGIASADRLEIVRGQFESSGFSDQVVDLLQGGTRDTTSAAYQSAWNCWHGWCVRDNTDPVAPSLAKVLEFLSSLLREGKAYRTINVARSMLFSTLGKINGYDIGNHPLIVKLMREACKTKPRVPKYSGFWDVSTVVDYFISLGPNSGLSFLDLSKKLVVLLALSSLCRVSELANIDRDSIVTDEGQAKFSLSKPRKTQ